MNAVLLARRRPGLERSRASATPRATDPDEQAQLTAAYASGREFSLPGSELPELACIYPDDVHTLAEIGLRAEPMSAWRSNSRKNR